MDLRKHLMEWNEQHKLFVSGSAVVVAVSGGPDSVALCHAMTRLASTWSLRIVAAHVNHGFRGQESDAEQQHVEAMVSAWGIPCESACLDIPSVLEKEGGNAQDIARKLRYAFLEEVARKHGAVSVLLAHHADDQAETVLMRLMRGAGADGLEGIPMRRQDKGIELLRPLLSIYKEDLLHYCEYNGLNYVTDSSNASFKYLRNRIRLEVLPYLTQFNPQLIASLARTAEVLAGEQDFMNKEAEAALERIAICESDSVKLSRADFLSAPVALQRRMIKLILSYLCAGIEADYGKVEAIRAAIRRDTPPNVHLDLGEGAVFRREYEALFLAKIDPDQPMPYAYIISDIPTAMEISELHARLWVEVLDGEVPLPGVNSHDEAYFDLEQVSLPLTLRSRRQGDKIALPGMAGRKKIKELFMEEKISPSMRQRQLLVEDAEGRILWIPGVRRSRHAETCPQTSRILHMRLDRLIH